MPRSAVSNSLTFAQFATDAQLCPCCIAAQMLRCALQYATIIIVCGLAVLLLRHRRRIPPFSSYGGILKARSQTTAPFFVPAAGRIGRLRRSPRSTWHREAGPNTVQVAAFALTPDSPNSKIVRLCCNRTQTETPHMKTFSAKPADITRDWFVVDAHRQGAGPPREPDRAAPARQAQADLHAAHGHRRLHRRHQRREAARHRQQGRRQALPPPHRLPGRHLDDDFRARCRRASPAARWKRRSRACCPRGRSATRC